MNVSIPELLRGNGATYMWREPDIYDAQRQLEGIKIDAYQGAWAVGHYVNHQPFPLLLNVTGDVRGASINKVYADQAYPRMITVPTLFLAYPWSTNYEHWMVDDLPRLWAWSELIGHCPDLHVFVCGVNTLPRHVMEGLALYGVPQDRILIWDGRAVRFDQVFVPSYLGYDYVHLYPEAWDVYARMRVAATSTNVQRGLPKRVYVARTAQYHWHGRTLVNELDVQRTMLALGYSIVYPEAMSLADEIATFAGAQRVVVPAGAGAMNLAWCSRGCRALILDHPRLAGEWHEKVGVEAGCEVYRLRDGGELTTDVEGPNVPWQLDLGKLHLAVEEMG